MATESLTAHLELDGAEHIDAGRFRRVFLAALATLPDEERAALKSKWAANPLAAVTILNYQDGRGIMSHASAGGACMMFNAHIVKAVDDDLLDELIVSTLCEALQSADGIRFETCKEKQQHADSMARKLGANPARLDTFMAKFLTRL